MNISRILIVGTGSIATRHYSIAKQLFPTADIRVYSESGLMMAGARMVKIYSDFKDFNPQLSVIATSSTAHLRHALYLAEIGSHLLIEKPISANIDGIAHLLELSNKYNLQILVGYNLNYLPSLHKFSELINDGQIGRILDVRIQAGHDLTKWRPGRDYRNSVSSRRESGGGVLRELSHELSYILEIFGIPKWISASIGKVSDLDLDVEDIAHLTMEMCSEGDHKFLLTVLLDFIRQDKTRICTVIGTNGTLEWDLLEDKIVFKCSNNESSTLFLGDSNSLTDSYRLEWEHLVRLIASGDRRKNSLSNALTTLEMILSCEQSQLEGRKVRFSPLDWKV